MIAENDSVKFQLHIELANQFDLKQIDSTLYYTQKFIAFADETESSLYKGQAYFKHGLILFQKYVGSDTALYFLSKAFDHAQVLADTTLMSKVKGTMASVYMNRNNTELAVDHFVEALKLIEKKNDVDNTTTKVVFLNNMARIEFVNKNFDKALRYFKEILPMAEKIERPMSQTIALSGLSTIYNELNRTDSAIYYMQRSLEVARENGLTFMEANSLGNLGYFNVNSGEFAEAEILAKQALDIFTANGWTSELSFAYNVLSNAQSGLSKYTQAIENGNTAIDIAKEYERSDHLVIALRDMARIYDAVGQHKKAYDLMEEHHILQDSLNKMERAEIVEDMKARYDAERKEARIRSLDLENNLLLAKAESDRVYLFFLLAVLVALLILIVFGLIYFRQRQVRLALEKENELREAESDGAYQRSAELARLIHDGPVNDLKQLTLEQEAITLPNAMNSQLLSIMGEMRLLAHQLEYRGIATGNILHDLTRLCQLVRKQHQQVDISFNLFPNQPQIWNSIPSTTQIFLFQTTREAVYNALKHASPTVIALSFTLLEENLTVKIEDNGSGMEANKHAGIGVKNMMREVAQRNGEIEFKNAKPHGTIITVSLPLEQENYTKLQA